MEKIESQIFKMDKNTLVFDTNRSILFCKQIDNKIQWAKKITNILSIDEIIEDQNNYYIICEANESSGLYISVKKSNGNTLWEIPGKSYLQIQHENFLYLIFIDANERYYLIKVDKENGKKLWHYEVGIDLCEYKISPGVISLIYSTGKTESISSLTGIQLY